MENSDFLDWSNTHKAYDLKNTWHIQCPNGFEEVQWLVSIIESQNQAIRNSPFWFLLNDNRLLQLFKQDKIHLIHTTTQLSTIEKTWHLYSSSWCLVWSMYCTPAFEKDEELHLHNLGSYIGLMEAPFAIEKSNKRRDDIQHLLIEVSVPKGISARMMGIDYLQLWNIHYNIYKWLEYLLSWIERHSLESSVIEKIRSCVELLHRITEWIKGGSFENYNHFFEAFLASIPNLPILGYIYFESISEYLQLFSTDNQSYNCASKSEINNRHYKSLLFWLYPNQVEKFNLWKFTPSIKEVIEFLETLKLQQLINVDYEHMFQYIQSRLIIYIATDFLTPECFEKKFNRNNIQWNFNNLLVYAKPLMGHLIHRELRNFGRYPDFYYYFEQEKALKIRNYRNNMNILFPFNGITPKWEIGINPAFPELSYNIYTTKEISNDNNNLVLKKDKKLKVTIVPRIVDLKNSFMRM